MEYDWQTTLPLELKNTCSQILAHGLSISELLPSLQLKDVAVFLSIAHCPCRNNLWSELLRGYMLIKDMNLKTLKILQHFSVGLKKCGTY